MLRADALGVLFALLSTVVLLAATVHEVLDGVRERVFPGSSCCSRRADRDVPHRRRVQLLRLLRAVDDRVVRAGDLRRGRRELGAALVFTTVNLLGSFIFLLSVAGIYRITGSLAMATSASGCAPSTPTRHPRGRRVLRRVQRQARPVPVPLLAADRLRGLAAGGRGDPERRPWRTSAPTGAAVRRRDVPRELRARGDRADRDRLRVDPVRRPARGVARDDAARRSPTRRSGRSATSWWPSASAGPSASPRPSSTAVVNALNKTLLFLTARMRGALVGARVRVGALSVAGIPPAAGFVGKLELFRAAVGRTRR